MTVFWDVCMLAAQLCLTLCDSMDCSLLGSSVHGILQARIPERLASVWGWLFPHSVVLSQKLHHTLNSKQEVIPIAELSAVLTHRMVPEWDLVCISHGLSCLGLWHGRNLAIQHSRKSKDLQRLLCSSLIPSLHRAGSQKSKPRLPSWNLKGMDMNSCMNLSLKKKILKTFEIRGNLTASVVHVGVDLLGSSRKWKHQGPLASTPHQSKFSHWIIQKRNIFSSTQ